MKHSFTIPHKESGLKCCDEIDPKAKVHPFFHILSDILWLQPIQSPINSLTSISLGRSLSHLTVKAFKNNFSIKICFAGNRSS